MSPFESQRPSPANNPYISQLYLSIEKRRAANKIYRYIGVVSIRSFELLVQWLYLARVKFDELTQEGGIATTLECVRFGDIRDELTPALSRICHRANVRRNAVIRRFLPVL